MPEQEIGRVIHPVAKALSVSIINLHFLAHAEFLNSKQASLMANNSVEVQSVTPTDLEKVIKQFESSSLKHPPMPALSKLPNVAPSTLNFNSPNNGGHQVSLEIITCSTAKSAK
ncbi:hypothetical protein V6N12_030774 [Hibiscus sabdariffa]|uniref:Uncharacterized protein n=1 Tax=Hibiscus sabdariffa TaxID=183260 RepID=A0ABR2E6Z9_9ROSI